MPRCLPFARALALLSLTACGASAPPPASPEPTPTAARVPPPAGDVCSRCVCYESSNPPSCYAVRHSECCDAIIMEGPLPPPDLPA